MNTAVGQLNLIFAWIWILAGFLSGLALGLKFQDENWRGGYASHPRRMYRLAHVSFFGLGAVNLLFYLTLPALGEAALPVRIASPAFILGGLTMPPCCWLMARNKRFQWTFAVPVFALLCGAILTLINLIP